MFLATLEITPWSVTCITLAMFIIGLGKAGFGAGIGIVVTPMMALVIEPTELVLAMTLPALFIGDISSLWVHERSYDKPLLKQLIPAGLVGVVLAAILLRLLQDNDVTRKNLSQILAVAIGLIALVIVTLQAWRLFGGRLPAIPQGPRTTYVVAFVEAFISTLTHSAGVLMTIHLLSKKLSKLHFVTTFLMTFLFVNAGKLIAYSFVNHLITFDTLAAIAPFLPAIPLGALVGVWLNKRISHRPFTIFLYTIAVATAVRMLVKVFWG